MRAVCGLIFGLLLLTGCDDATIGAAPTETSGVTPVANNPRPGPNSPSVFEAGTLFSKVCAETAPSFRQANAAIGQFPFVQSAGTGTYFHRNLDLSFKVPPELGSGKCSMVTTSKEDPLAFMTALASFVAASADNGSNKIKGDANTGLTMGMGNGKVFDITPYLSEGRLTYFRVSLT